MDPIIRWSITEQPVLVWLIYTKLLIDTKLLIHTKWRKLIFPVPAGVTVQFLTFTLVAMFPGIHSFFFFLEKYNKMKCKNYHNKVGQNKPIESTGEGTRIRDPLVHTRELHQNTQLEVYICRGPGADLSDPVHAAAVLSS